jgi:uncharacterized membrane protein
VSEAVPTRRGHLDWLRGVAVLIMIEAHLIDSWTRLPDRHSRQFLWAVILGGFGAPLFLFLAGVAIPLSAGSKLRRSGDVKAATWAVVRRGLEVYGLAFLFRLQAWLVSWGRAWTLLKVDILNIMGPSIAAVGALWGTVRTLSGRRVLFALVTVGIGLATPVVRNLPGLAALPDPIEAYIRPVAGLSNFVLLPWAGFVSAGALIGLELDAIRMGEERRANRMLLLAGLTLASLAYCLSFGPSFYSRSDFWTTSPAFFFLRVGIMTAAVGVAFYWESCGGADRWSPLKQLGRTSLFIYWIHVEMVYGLMSLPLHKALSLPQACIAFVVFSAFMLLCSIAKDRIVARFSGGARL